MEQLNAVILIQTFFLKKQFLKNLHECEHIFKILWSFNEMKSKINQNQIDSFNKLDDLWIKMTRYLRNKNIISQINTLLKCAQRIIKINEIKEININSKQFLSLYTILIFPEFTLSDVDNVHIKSDLIVKSSKVINCLNNLLNIKKINNYQIHNFVQVLNNYGCSFKIFMSIDKIIKVTDLMIRWYDLDKTISFMSHDTMNQDNKESIEYLEKQKIIIQGFIKLTDPGFDINLLKEYKDISQRIDKTIQQCYWDLLEEDIYSEKNIILHKSLEEIKNQLIILDKKSKKELDEFFDLEYIIQKINNHVFSYHDLIELSNYIVEKIMELEAPVRNIKTKESWDVLKNKLNIEVKSIQSNKSFMSKAVVVCIRFILQKIYEIFNDIIHLKIMMDFS